MTTSTPTPNDMPGAQQAEPNPQLQEPVSTSTPPEPAPRTQEPPAAVQEQAPATDAPGPDTVEYWQRRSHEWESKARLRSEVVDKAKKWDEAEASRRTKEENQAIEIQQRDARITQLELEARREKIARETGVLPDFLGGGTEEDMREAAKRALEWRGVQAPPESPKPPTAAVPASTVTSADSIGHAPNGMQQLTREQFVALDPAERMAAVRAGQCASLGIGKPKEQRRLGNQLEIGANMATTKQ